MKHGPSPWPEAGRPGAAQCAAAAQGCVTEKAKRLLVPAWLLAGSQ